jgi:hypothetical protein
LTRHVGNEKDVQTDYRLKNVRPSCVCGKTILKRTELTQVGVSVCLCNAVKIKFRKAKAFLQRNAGLCE